MRTIWADTAREARTGGADHELLQEQRPADVVGFYGGLTSTVPRLYELARFYKQQGVVTIAGGQHFVGDNTVEALHNGIDYVVFGEGEQAIRELLEVIEGRRRRERRQRNCLLGRRQRGPHAGPGAADGLR